ncbi:hypothetical protein Poli38472_007491 [Pythium oligandrum]|uniref:FYVE-type domain-containing protein n=1 Tax=Pythium oligandrum TaxID=41045 RepID=A0A8K1CRA7_PYTOL|nr:hypothetical protein Poli38472_007491 [Pythium oligandrum]|eukprot:TMW67819.1 hypothetical protein Poli38472_007491 [Pythium oligandrum]
MSMRGFFRRGSSKRTELSAMSSGASTSSQSPISSDLPPLAEEQKETFIHEARDAYIDLFHSIEIAQAKTSSGGTHLEGVSEETGSTVWMCTTTTLYGKLEEVAELYLSSDCHFILDFSQSKRLYELEWPSETHPLRCTALRWSKWTAIANVIKDRDFVRLEYMDSFEDQSTGHRGWARATKSVELASCPPSQEPNGPRRGELFVSGKIIRETDHPGMLEFTTLIHLDVKRAVPAWVRKSVLKTRKINALNMNHLLKIRRLLKVKSSVANQQLWSHRETFKQVDQRTCHGCHEHISRWNRMYTCRDCSEVICPQCAAISYYDPMFHQLKNRICIDCSVVDPEQSILGAARELEQRQKAQEFNLSPYSIDDDWRDHALSSFSQGSDDWNAVQNELTVSRTDRHAYGSNVISFSQAFAHLPSKPWVKPRTKPASASTSQERSTFDLSHLQHYAAPKQSTH